MNFKTIAKQGIVLGMLFILALLSACTVSQVPQKIDDGGIVPDSSEIDLGRDYVLDKGTYEESDNTLSENVDVLTFSSQEDLKNFISSHGTGNSWGGGIMFAKRSNGLVMDGADMVLETAVAEDSTGGLDFSETNNQVAGVDEADIIKTDGDYIYTITDNTLFIIKAYPGKDAEVVSKIEFDSNPSSLFIDGDKLAVFGNYYDADFFKKVDFRPQSGMTFFDVYDVSDRKSPELLKQYKFEGSYSNARMTEGQVYFVVRSTPEIRPVPMPVIFEGDVMRNVMIDDVRYFNIPYDYPQFVSVHSVDLESLKNVDSMTVAVEGSQNLYMSKNNIYLTYTEYVNEWEIEKKIRMDLLEEFLTDSDKKLIKKIKQTDNEVLSQSEKENKIYQIYMSYQNFMTSEEREELQDKVDELLVKELEEYEHFEYTVINKLSFADGEIDVKANGKVPGHVINQFSLDEFDSNLRIGTTINGRWDRFEKESTKSTNNVYVLDSDLEIIGELLDLAEGERIYSTRFIGERLYMVTFRQVDPFFVIDLSNPEKPESLGELKIPGFSRYLHPYDENTIIGIGRDATETGRTKGLKISLFDVSDVSSPEEVAKFVTDERYAQSSAEYEHKAFLFSREKNLLVIPAYSYDYKYNGESSEGYNGAFVFDINKEEIELRGLIDHSKAAEGRYWGAVVERSLFIEDMLYTKSPKLLRVNALDDLSSVANVDLKPVSTSNMPIY